MAEEERLLRDAQAIVDELAMLPEDSAALAGIVRSLDELLLLVVVGEYNAGKSTLINCLLGEALLEAGDLPTTREVHILKHGEPRSTRQLEPGLLQHQLPADLLRDLTVVDTPGTNSMQRREEELTQGFVPRADLVLFLTTFLRPYTASEHEFLRKIRRWGKKVFFAVNFVDVATDADSVERVRAYVRDQATSELGEAPDVFVLSAKEALRGPAHVSERNEYPAFEAHLKKTLGDRGRIRLKLRSPLDTLRTILARQGEALGERVRLVEGDRVAMDRILADVDEYERRMQGELTRYQAQVDNVVLQMERRGHRFLDEMVRLSNVFRLRDADVVENRFRHEVVADAPRRIEEEVGSLIDWLVRENLGAWDRAQVALEERRRALHASARETRFTSRSYVYNREEIFSNLAGPVKRHLETFDAREEADRIVGSVNHAIARTFGTEALVVGVGAMLTAAFTSLTIDVTGTVGGTILLIAGAFLLPRRKARLKRELTARVETLREELAASIERCFREEVRRYAEQLRSVFQPERDAARALVASLRETESRLAAVEERRVALLDRIDA